MKNKGKNVLSSSGGHLAQIITFSTIGTFLYFILGTLLSLIKLNKITKK